MSIFSTLLISLMATFGSGEATPADVAPSPVGEASPFVMVDDTFAGANESSTGSHATAPVRVAAAPESPRPVGAPDASSDSVDNIVAKLQKAYEGTTDFTASFTQRYTYMALKKTQESTGTVQFKKPGRMRWDYSAPTKKSFVVNEGKLHILQPEDNTGLVDHCFKQDGLTASVSFLWGAGDIRGQFDVSKFGGVFGAPTDHHLLLIPKSKNGVFAKLILVVDPQSARVKQSVVVDPQGNVNQFIFDNAAFNTGVKDDAFTVQIPKGMAVSRVPGSCDPNARALPPTPNR